MFIDVQEKLESTEYGVFLFLLQEKNYFTGINQDLLIIIEFNYRSGNYLFVIHNYSDDSE